MKELKEKIIRLWKSQKFGKDSFLIMILGGLLLLVIAWPVEKKESSKEGSTQSGLMVSSSDTMNLSQGAETQNLSAYAQSMEERLTGILESMEGVGKVEVMITYASSYEMVPLQEVSSSTHATSETDSNGGSRTIQEESLSQETVYTVDEHGNQVPYVIGTREPEIIGVAVSAQGGASPVIQKNITDVIQSLFRIEANRIIVTRMKS